MQDQWRLRKLTREISILLASMKTLGNKTVLGKLE